MSTDDHRHPNRVAIVPEDIGTGIRLTQFPAPMFEDGTEVEVVLIGGLYSVLPSGDLVGERPTYWPVPS